MIGPGVVGHWVAPGERDVPDPDEYLKVPARTVKPRNGLLSFRFMEPMEETVYLDKVMLLAIDHPAAYEVFPNERFVSAPPFPEFRVIASRGARAPAGAWDDRGNDVVALISKRDRKYVTNFEGLPFAGFARTIAVDHRWLYRLLHGDFHVRGGSGGDQSDSALCGGPRCARQVGARHRRYGFPSGT